MPPKKDAAQNPESVLIDWNNDNGQEHVFDLVNIQQAHALIESSGHDVESAIEAVRCAAFLYPRIFSRSDIQPVKAVKAWNLKHPPGTEVRCWPAGRTQQCVMTKTLSRAFEFAGFAMVLVEEAGTGKEAVALQDCDHIST